VIGRCASRERFVPTTVSPEAGLSAAAVTHADSGRRSYRAVLAAALYPVGATSAETIMSIGHLGMIPAMLGRIAAGKWMVAAARRNRELHP
jgi:hypothetical protein